MAKRSRSRRSREEPGSLVELAVEIQKTFGTLPAVAVSIVLIILLLVAVNCAFNSTAKRLGENEKQMVEKQRAEKAAWNIGK